MDKKKEIKKIIKYLVVGTLTIASVLGIKNNIDINRKLRETPQWQVMEQKDSVANANEQLEYELYEEYTDKYEAYVDDFNYFIEKNNFKEAELSLNRCLHYVDKLKSHNYNTSKYEEDLLKAKKLLYELQKENSNQPDLDV
jgi:hypothetical protein